MGLAIIKMDYYVVNVFIRVILAQVQQFVQIALRVKEIHTIIKAIA